MYTYTYIYIYGVVHFVHVLIFPTRVINFNTHLSLYIYMCIHIYMYI